ncbi:hypothetical protein [Cupriavidus numazuensis]|uniref:Uncharacterized protein n=1 Tax=Cupriavidus numazuensis TaxID=221992 RepID=A0ABM8TAA0_9BURK|nr:hypothetical protein [Cupriavidus numazuensis]CAG2130728.1 hypothetical protein LMG26411_00402 [Cupriavidus numazuensis]
MIRRAAPAAILLSLCAVSMQAYAERPPEAIMDSCLLFDKAMRSSIVITPIDGPEVLEDEYAVPGYTVFKPGIRSNPLAVGYATSQRGMNDFVMVGKYRGYLRRAVPLGKFKPERIEPPESAAYAIVQEGASRYVCVMTSDGNGSAAFVRSALVARIPAKKIASMTLYYKVADVKKFKVFDETRNDEEKQR